MTVDTVGGVWTYTLELVQALKQFGVEVAIATMGAPLTPKQWQEIESLQLLAVFPSRFKLEWMDDPWDDIQQAGEWLLQLQQQLQPDVVHLNGFVHASLPWRVPVVVVAHSCVLSWWQAVKGEAAPSTWTRYRTAVTRGLRAASIVVAPSQAMLNALQQHYGFPHAQVIPNGRDASLFRPQTKSDFILSVGRFWDEAKNLSALEQIAADLSYPVYVAGDLRHPQGKVVHPTHVRSLGQLSASELNSWLTKAAIYALPAQYEPFGLSILEAGLAKCTLVLGDIPSLRENWQDAALFVPPNDSQRLRDTLNKLIAAPHQRQILAQKAYVRALEFTPQRMAAAYLATYQRAMVVEHTAVGKASRREGIASMPPCSREEFSCK